MFLRLGNEAQQAPRQQRVTFCKSNNLSLKQEKHIDEPAGSDGAVRARSFFLDCAIYDTIAAQADAS